MKILYTADIHLNERHLESMCAIALDESVEAIIIGGDLIPHHLPRLSAKGLLKAQTAYLKRVLAPKISELKRKKDIAVFLDLGNDDLFGARRILEALDGDVIHLLHLRRHSLTDQVDIIGYMVVPPTPFQRKDWEKPDTRDIPYAPGNRILLEGYISRKGVIEPTALDLDSEDTIEADLSELSKRVQRPFIFVAHSPPYNTPLDVLEDGTHVGSRAIRRFIESWAAQKMLIASLHGHIHEAPFRSDTVQTRIVNALCLNPGQDAMFRYMILKLVSGPLGPELRVLNSP
jgi:Icc-related predicted phosphoesterase